MKRKIVHLFITLISSAPCFSITQNKVSKITRIRASLKSVQSVKDRNGISSSSSCLEEYMQLPASQYSCVPMPLNSSLNRIHGTLDQFELKVPPIKINLPIAPTVEVRPLVVAKVDVAKDHVLIISSSCEINGSKIIQDLNINDFFDFLVQVCLTWDTSSASSITAKSKIELDLKPLPGIFKVIPTNVLENVGNNAIRLSLKYLQNNFMKSLGKDFERWSVDEEYRMEREKLQFLADESIMLEDDNYASARNVAFLPRKETLHVYLKP